MVKENSFNGWTQSVEFNCPNIDYLSCSRVSALRLVGMTQEPTGQPYLPKVPDGRLMDLEHVNLCWLPVLRQLTSTLGWSEKPNWKVSWAESKMSCRKSFLITSEYSNQRFYCFYFSVNKEKILKIITENVSLTWVCWISFKLLHLHLEFS